MKFVPITIERNKHVVDFYRVLCFANKLLSRDKVSFKGANRIPYYYFKIKNKTACRLEKSIARFSENKLVVFLSEEDFLVWVSNFYIHIWDPKKPWLKPGTPGDFLKEKNRFLNWFSTHFQNLTVP